MPNIGRRPFKKNTIYREDFNIEKCNTWKKMILWKALQKKKLSQ